MVDLSKFRRTEYIHGLDDLLSPAEMAYELDDDACRRLVAALLLQALRDCDLEESVDKGRPPNTYRRDRARYWITTPEAKAWAEAIGLDGWGVKDFALVRQELKKRLLQRQPPLRRHVTLRGVWPARTEGG